MDDASLAVSTPAQANIQGSSVRRDFLLSFVFPSSHLPDPSSFTEPYSVAVSRRGIYWWQSPKRRSKGGSFIPACNRRYKLSLFLYHQQQQTTRRATPTHKPTHQNHGTQVCLLLHPSFPSRSSRTSNAKADPPPLSSGFVATSQLARSPPHSSSDTSYDYSSSSVGYLSSYVRYTSPSIRDSSPDAHTAASHYLSSSRQDRYSYDNQDGQTTPHLSSDLLLSSSQTPSSRSETSTQASNSAQACSS
jgi:hypothetical protein